MAMNPTTPQAAWHRVDDHMRKLYGLSLADMAIDEQPGYWRVKRTGARFAFWDIPNARMGISSVTSSWDVLKRANEQQPPSGDSKGDSGQPVKTIRA